MEDVITRIKDYVIKLYPNIKTDLSIDDDYILEIVRDVVDRAMAFMNRAQLLSQYEDDLEFYPDPDDEFWDNYEYPIPMNLERTLARVVIQSTKTILSQNVAEVGAVSSVSDNGQSVSFKEQLDSFFGSSDDSEVFSGSLSLLRASRLPSTIDDDTTDEHTNPF